MTQLFIIMYSQGYIKSLQQMGLEDCKKYTLPLIKISYCLKHSLGIVHFAIFVALTLHFESGICNHWFFKKILIFWFNDDDYQCYNDFNCLTDLNMVVISFNVYCKYCRVI